MAMCRKIAGNFRSDMVTDDEIMQFLQQKVAEKYPDGEVEAIKHLVGNGIDFQVRTKPTIVGTYNTDSCAVQVWRKKDGKLLVQVNAGDADGLDLVQIVLSLFAMGKRSALVDEVAGWLTPFLKGKQREYLLRVQTGTDEVPEQSQGPAKNKTAYLLLGIFLGGFGIHNFYAGYIQKGVIQLLITLLTGFMLSWISWIWAIVDVCTVKQDAAGSPFV